MQGFRLEAANQATAALGWIPTAAQHPKPKTLNPSDADTTEKPQNPRKDLGDLWKRTPIQNERLEVFMITHPTEACSSLINNSPYNYSQPNMNKHPQDLRQNRLKHLIPRTLNPKPETLNPGTPPLNRNSIPGACIYAGLLEVR